MFNISPYQFERLLCGKAPEALQERDLRPEACSTLGDSSASLIGRASPIKSEFGKCDHIRRSLAFEPVNHLDAVLCAGIRPRL